MKETVFRVRPMPIKEQKLPANYDFGYKWYAEVPAIPTYPAYKTPSSTQRWAIHYVENCARGRGRGEIRVFNKAGKLRQRYIIFTIEQTIRIPKKIKR